MDLQPYSHDCLSKIQRTLINSHNNTYQVSLFQRTNLLIFQTGVSCFSFTLFHSTLLALTDRQNHIQRNKYTCCAWAGETFFQLCCCVSFWFWREICFGFTYYYLRTQSTIQLWCCFSFFVLAGNSFWSYVRTQCTIQLCGCVVFWLWWKIVLKMRTRFYKKTLLGYFIMIRLFLENIETFLCKQKLVNNYTIPSKQQFHNHDSFSKISRPSTA